MDSPLVFACLDLWGFPPPQKAPDDVALLAAGLPEGTSQKPVGDSLHQPLLSTLPSHLLPSLPSSSSLLLSLPLSLAFPFLWHHQFICPAILFLSILSFPSWALAQEARAGQRDIFALEEPGWVNGYQERSSSTAEWV